MLKRLLNSKKRPWLDEGDKGSGWNSLKQIPPFLKLIWETHRGMTAANVALRFIKSLMPLLILFIGKEIIDEIIQLIAIGEQADFTRLWIFIGLELLATLFNELLSRGISLLDALLGDLFANTSSIRLMEHAATLDLEQF